MWAQDVDTMYAYAEASADAATITPFTSPPATAEPGENVTRAPGSRALKAAPEVISAGHQLISTIPDALVALSASPLTTFDAFLSPVTASLSKLSSLSAPSDFAINHLNSLNKQAALHSAAALLCLLPNRARAGGAPASTGVGRATSVGKLSVPRAWTASTPARKPSHRSAVGATNRCRLVATSAPPHWPLTR